MKKGLESEWLAEISQLLAETEGSEATIYGGRSASIANSRRLSGSYYTPIDVARYFWNELFEVAGLKEIGAITEFAQGHLFVEPAVGSGALFFGLLERLAEEGVSPHVISQIDADLIDIDEIPLNFVNERMKLLENKFGIRFHNVQFKCADYRNIDYSRGNKSVMFFGNPPFVTNTNSGQGWKNLFGDFVERSVRFAGQRGIVQFVVPISLSFSRDYRLLRRLLCREGRRVYFSHFDNIPDTLFRVGDSQTNGLGHVNSQRCSVMISVPAERGGIFSTQLRRWARRERPEVLGSKADYVDVSRYSFDDQIPRPVNSRIMEYFERTALAFRLNDLSSGRGIHVLRVASVARNFVGVREHGMENVNVLKFASEEDFLAVMWVVSSDIFFDYWRTVGDGFHITKANLERFPVHDEVLKHVVKNLAEIRCLWNKRQRYAKSKLNAGINVRSFDFSAAVPSLYAVLGM